MTIRLWTSGRVLTLGWVGCGVALGAMLMTLVPATFRAESQARIACTQLRTVAHQTDELARLRSQAMRPLTDSHEEALASTVSSVLAQVGLPASTLESLSPQSATAEPVGGGVAGGGAVGGNAARVYRRRATLVLGPITLPQMGQVLSTWRSLAPRWIPTRIEMTPGTGGRSAPVAPGSDLPLRVVVALEQVDLDLPGSGPAANALPSTPSPRPAAASKRP